MRTHFCRFSCHWNGPALYFSLRCPQASVSFPSALTARALAWWRSFVFCPEWGKDRTSTRLSYFSVPSATRIYFINRITDVFLSEMKQKRRVLILFSWIRCNIDCWEGEKRRASGSRAKSGTTTAASNFQHVNIVALIWKNNIFYVFLYPNDPFSMPQ